MFNHTYLDSCAILSALVFCKILTSFVVDSGFRNDKLIYLNIEGINNKMKKKNILLQMGMYVNFSAI